MPVGITIATLAVLMGGKSGGPTHFLVDADKKIKSAVQDKTRRKAILAETTDLSKKLEALETKINGHFQDYIRVHSDYQSSEGDFDAITATLAADQQEAAKIILDSRVRIREQMTNEEWTTVFKSSD